MVLEVQEYHPTHKGDMPMWSYLAFTLIIVSGGWGWYRYHAPFKPIIAPYRAIVESEEESR